MEHIIHIRSAIGADAPTLVDLVTQLGYPMSLAHMQEQIEKFTEHPELGHIFVAQIEDQVVGCISVSQMQWFHCVGKCARITSLVVDEHYRRQGIGKMLVEYAEQYALASGCTSIELTSAVHRSALGTHDFYKALGYDDLSEMKKYMAKEL